MFRRIVKELKEHVRFTGFGAAIGVVIMVIVTVGKVSPKASENIFYTLHPLHVVLSALATTAMFKRYRGKSWRAWLIGYVGSVGIATLSDTIFPYLGGLLLKAKMEFHAGFIEKWWLVNPLAVVGIIIGYLRPMTKVPHAGHVLLSTCASLFTLVAFGVADWMGLLPFVFLILFFSVWLPCCLSDIVFPLLFVK